jgi:hypothetical protein
MTQAPDQLDAELRDALERILARRATSLRSRTCAYDTSHAMRELDVALDDGRQLAVMFKDCGPAAWTETARRVKPAFLYDPRREIEVYRDFLAPAGLAAPAFYGALVDEPANRYWLFTEHVGAGRPLWQFHKTEWLAVARAVAAVHAAFDRRTAELPTSLLRYDRNFYQAWLDRACAFRPELEPLRAAYGRVIDRLLALPPTFIHGECYASNVLLAGDRVCLIDWETAAIGPGVIDLAALIAGDWTDAERATVIAAYGANPEDVDYARLHLAVQWLGWSNDWKPPNKNRQDWLGEAQRHSQKLGVWS